MVDEPCDTWNVESIKPFADILLNSEEKPTYRQSLASKDIKPKDKSSPEIIEQITPTTPRKKLFSLVKAQLANLEAEFTMF
jgi:hypothetical protein